MSNRHRNRQTLRGVRRVVTAHKQAGKNIASVGHDLGAVTTTDSTNKKKAAQPNSFLNPGDPQATRMALLSQQGQFK